MLCCHGHFPHAARRRLSLQGPTAVACSKPNTPEQWSFTCTALWGCLLALRSLQVAGTCTEQAHSTSGTTHLGKTHHTSISGLALWPLDRRHHHMCACCCVHQAQSDTKTTSALFPGTPVTCGRMAWAGAVVHVCHTPHRCAGTTHQVTCPPYTLPAAVSRLPAASLAFHHRLPPLWRWDATRRCPTHNIEELSVQDSTHCTQATTPYTGVPGTPARFQGNVLGRVELVA
jgi:hypothetical protein